MKMTRRRIVALVAVLLSVLLVVVVGAVLSLDAERIGALAAARAEAALGRDVEIERARIRLLPIPAVVLVEVRVGGPRAEEAFAAPAGEARPMAAVREVELRPRLLPLLRRQVVINSLVLDRPSLSIEVDAAGVNNLPAVQETGDQGAVEVFELRRLRVRDGLITYRDARDGTVVRLAGVEQTLKFREGEPVAGMEVVRLDGTLGVGALDAALPGRLARPVHGLRLQISHAAELDRGADRLLVDRLRAQVQDVVLNGHGAVERLSDAEARAVALQLETGSFDVGRLMSSLPEGMRSLPQLGAGQALTASGRARLDARIEGRLGGGATPELNGLLSLDGVSVAQRRNGTLASGLRGEVRFTQQSLASAGLTGSILDQPLHLDFAVHDAAAPHGHVAVRTDLDLEQMGRRGLLPEGWRGHGIAGMNARADGPLLEPERLRFSGTVAASGARLQNPDWRQPVEVRQGSFTLYGQEIRSQGLQLALGGSDLTVDLTLGEWLPALLREGAPAPVLAFDARAQRFDWDEVFGAGTAEFGYGELFFARLQDASLRGGRTVAEAAEAAGLGLPELPDLRLDGRLRAASLIRGGLEIRDLDLALAGRNRQMDLRSARLRVEQPGMRLAARIGAAADVPASGGGIPLSLEFGFDDPGTGEFVGRFETLRGHLTGSLAIAGTARLQLDRHLLPVRESLAGEGAFDLVGGRLVNWPLARAIGRQVGVAQFDVLDVRAGTGRFRIAGPWIEFDEWTVDFRDVLVHAAGRFDLAGRLDLRTTLDLSARFAGLARGTPVATLLRGVTGPTGWIPIGARIGGTTADPTVRLDLTQAQQHLAGTARDAARDAAGSARDVVVDEARERLREAVQRPVPPLAGAEPAQPDTTGFVEEPATGPRREGDVIDRLRRALDPRARRTPSDPLGNASPRTTR
jgi:hypothetical protein